MAARFLIAQANDEAILAQVEIQLAKVQMPRETSEVSGVAAFSTEPIITSRIGHLTLNVMGRLFDRQTYQGVTELTVGKLLPTAKAAMSLLLTEFWGSYVALMRTADGEASIFRDPSGALPCYLLRAGPITAAASDIGVLVAAGLLDPIVNWSIVDHQFRYPNQRLIETALEGVVELLPGFAFDFGDDVQDQRPIWSPGDFAARASAEADRSHALREAIDGTVSALASSRKLIVGVSGGLDSSILAASLADSEIPFECFTVATKEADGDERIHARRLCEALGLQLHEGIMSVEDVDPRRASAPHLPRPVGEPFVQSYDALARRAAQASEADTIVRGNGGDAVFCFMQTIWPLLDRLAVEGFGRGLYHTLNDTCRLTETKAIAVLRAAATARRRGRESSAARRDQRFLHEEGLYPKPLHAHPWLAGQAAELPGRSAHIEWITRVQRFTEGYARDATLELVCPLLAQPIVELCLTTPSWQWIEGGQNRAVARSAYVNKIPREILARTFKGGPDAFCIEIMESYRTILREHLLDGLLATNRVIDRTAVDHYLTSPGPLRDNGYLRVLALADAESWARHWTGARGDAIFSSGGS